MNTNITEECTEENNTLTNVLEKIEIAVNVIHIVVCIINIVVCSQSITIANELLGV